MDIGNNLLAEIRRLQSLLTERDKAIQDMKEERDDLEKTVEALKATLKQQERSAGKLWSLSPFQKPPSLTEPPDPFPK